MSPFRPRNDRSWQTFGPSTPIAVKGGLSTSRPRGAMAESWWSQRFVAVLESYGLGGRMQRGRTYARKGQVISLETNPGLLVALVQGSRATPYVVTVRATEPTSVQWSHLDAAMQARVGFAATLLAGEVPMDLEEAFRSAGVALFPASWRDVKSTCSCPDHENPCKHIAAVLYLFADRLDGDPWLLLAWRGRTREQVLAHLHVVETSGGGAAAAASAVAPWWPLVPGAVGGGPAGDGAGRLFVVPMVDLPDDPGRVLDRLAGLELDSSGTAVSVRLADAYRSALDP